MVTLKKQPSPSERELVRLMGMMIRLTLESLKAQHKMLLARSKRLRKAEAP